MKLLGRISDWFSGNRIDPKQLAKIEALEHKARKTAKDDRLWYKLAELKELARIVRERHQAKPDSEVVVRADTRGLVGPLAETIELCVRLGFKTPSISYQQAGP